MAFVYGDSYYGLRTWGSSSGTVKDASAALTATSGAGAVNWIANIGSGVITITVASGTTCSGEKIILEESDRYTYGSGLWGRNVFAGNADLQTIVSATSSIANVVQERVRTASATVSASATVYAIGGMRSNAYSQSVSTSSMATSNATLRVREGAATSTSASSATSNATCTWSTGATVSATGTLTGAAIQFFEERADKFTYGSGKYGYNPYDATDLQTIISATSVGTSCVGAKVNLAAANSIATSSATVSGEQIDQPTSAMSATSSATARAEAIFISNATSQSASTTAFTTVIRVREDTAAVSVTSGTATIGREKWEVIVNDTNTWTQIAA